MKTFGVPASDGVDLSAADGGPASTQPRSFSLLGRVAASLWFIVLAIVFGRGLVGMVRAVPPGGAGFSEWAAVVSRSCTLIFYVTLGWLILVRPRALARRNGAVPMVIAFSGTYAVWLMPFLPHGDISPTLQVISAAIALGGSFLIIFTVLYLGRSFSIVPQARKLVIRGPYRIVRHPLYVAEEIAIIGVLFQYAWYAALPFLVVHLGLQIRRMVYEESLLRAVFPDYEAYARRTPRLIPGIW